METDGRGSDSGNRPCAGGNHVRRGLGLFIGEKYQNLTGIAIAAGVMLVIIAAAALLPALRVLRIEPARALNSE